MKRITYNTHGNIVSVLDCNEERSVIAVIGARLGRLELFGRTFVLTGGECRLNLCGIDDGIYTPVLNIGGKRISLQAIRKQGDELLIAPPTKEEFARLALRVDALEEKCTALEKRLLEITALVNGASVLTI